MSLEKITESQLRASIEAWLSSNVNLSESPRSEVIDQLTPIMTNMLREYGFKILNNHDFDYIKNALNGVKLNKNIKKVLDEYNKSIEDIMGDKNE